MNPTGISTHLYAVDTLDLRKLETIKDAGFNLIELYANIPHFDFTDAGTIKQTARHLGKLELQVHSIHAPFYENLDEARKGNWMSISAVDDNLRKLSVDLIKKSIAIKDYLDFNCAVVHISSPGYDPVYNNRDACMKSLEGIIRCAEKYDVKIAIENIPSELGKSRNVLGIVNELKNRHAGICFDTGHANLEDSLTESFDMLKDLIITTHIHDNEGTRDAHLPPGSGNINWNQFLKRISDSGYKGPLMFEPDYQTPEQDLKKLGELKKTWEVWDSPEYHP